MSTAPNPNHYLKTKILTASPAELRMMLLDGSVRFARKGAEAVQAQDYEAAYENVTRAQAIVLELTNALDHDRDPDLCGRLSALYTYIHNRLLRGLTNRDTLVLREAVRLLEFEAETWRMALERMNELPDQPNRADAASVPPREAAHPIPSAGMLSLTG